MLNAGQGIFLGCLIDVKATMRAAGKTAVMEIIHGCAELVQSWHVRALESRIGDIDLVWKGGLPASARILYTGGIEKSSQHTTFSSRQLIGRN
ncbi:hypothetical protein KC336_g65 [Hortaea werneckii]|nr:hypothetical protein KC336_g65 [Hortaea werneckii]